MITGTTKHPKAFMHEPTPKGAKVTCQQKENSMATKVMPKAPLELLKNGEELKEVGKSLSRTEADQEPLRALLDSLTDEEYVELMSDISAQLMSLDSETRIQTMAELIKAGHEV